METGNLLEWDEIGGFSGTSGGGFAEVVASLNPARSGAWSARYRISPALTNDNERNGATAFLNNSSKHQWMRETGDIYFSNWFFFPEALSLNQPNNGWCAITYWYSRSIPWWGIYIQNSGSDMVLHIQNSGPLGPANHRTDNHVLPVGQWFNLEVRMTLSRQNNDGQVQVWLKRPTDPAPIEIFNFQNVNTGYTGGETHWFGGGLYGRGFNNALPFTIYTDDTAVSRSRIWQ